MPTKREMTRVEVMILNSIRDARKLTTLKDEVGRKVTKDLEALLVEADRRLLMKIHARLLGTKPDLLFTEAQATAVRGQVLLVTEFVKARLLGMTEKQAMRAIKSSYQETATLLEGLERNFAGIVKPLNLQQVYTMNPIVETTSAARPAVSVVGKPKIVQGPEFADKGKPPAVAVAKSKTIMGNTRSSLLKQHATSVDRYGSAMIGEFEKIIRQGVLRGATSREMVADLVEHGGPKGRVSLAAKVAPDGSVIRLREGDFPDGLFKAKKYWAERIIRTETAHAYEETKLQSMEEEQRTQFPDLQKKILAVMDNRTAPDSIAVHGQIRKLDDYFMDGAGRVYLRPPARPNDRETIIPWRPHWPETQASRPLPSDQVQKAIADSIPGKAANRIKSAQLRAVERKMTSARAKQERMQVKNRSKAFSYPA